MQIYNHKSIEPKWQKKWSEENVHRTEESSIKPKKYILDMFPYPSGAGLHVGHVESYTATDIYSRYLRLNGFNVLHPQGWDAFGLPAENYAIKTGIHPMETTKSAIANFTRQINSLGFSYDWSREINTSDPAYYKWTQWMFLLFYKNGLAYKKKANVNWCANCQTVLAREQAEGGKCERCGNEVMQKDLEQWFFKITDFIENQMVDKKEIKGLLFGLDSVDWPESTKSAQKNWIGRSEGAEFELPVKISFAKEDESGLLISVYTTRLDTVFGMTYAVVAPEHKIIQKLKNKIENHEEVEQYIIDSKKKTELERMELKEKTGVELKGIKAINFFNGKEIPVFIGDYVLGGYGTGAVMAVPAHDERDFLFAKKYNLPIITVIAKNEIATPSAHNDNESFTDDGILINSDVYDGLTSEQAREKMTKWLEEKGMGRKKVNYKIRDWLVSRQRYWGAPIPIIYCDHCGEMPVPEEDLPVKLPTDVDFKPTGESPLAHSKEFHDVKCPKCGKKARRESDTMDTFVCSSWYYLRYADPKNENEFASRDLIKKWLPVDVYVGGAEHSVLHLLYARFFTKVLQKYGFVDFNEPFLKLRHQGIILSEDGSKMSKSKGNVVNPDEVIEACGADALRMYEMFMGPLEDMKPWSIQGIVGVQRFLEKVWRLNEKILSDCGDSGETCEAMPLELKQLFHKTIKKVTEDIENFRFNTAISQMMIFVNFAGKLESLPKKMVGKFLILLSPFAPHIAEELWSSFVKTTEDKSEEYNQSIFKQQWPKYKLEMVKDDKINLVLQVNGKARDTVEVDAEIDEDEAKKIALENEKIKKWTEGKEILKVVFVKGRLVNIVVE